MSPIIRVAALVGLTVARIVGPSPSPLSSGALLTQRVAAIPQATYTESEIIVPYPSPTGPGFTFTDPKFHLVPIGTAAANTTYLLVNELATDVTFTATWTPTASSESTITTNLLFPATTQTGECLPYQIRRD